MSRPQSRGYSAAFITRQVVAVEEREMALCPQYTDLSLPITMRVAVKSKRFLSPSRNRRRWYADCASLGSRIDAEYTFPGGGGAQVAR